MEALIIGMHVAACEGDWSPWVMCPDAFKFGQNDNLMRGEFASRATMPATPTAGQRGSPYCKPVSWVH